jgi:hypothetical protein
MSWPTWTSFLLFTLPMWLGWQVLATMPSLLIEMASCELFAYSGLELWSSRSLPLKYLGPVAWTTTSDLLFIFWDTVLLSSPGCPQTHVSVASTSQTLRLHICAPCLLCNTLEGKLRFSFWDSFVSCLLAERKENIQTLHPNRPRFESQLCHWPSV